MKVTFILPILLIFFSCKDSIEIENKKTHYSPYIINKSWSLNSLTKFSNKGKLLWTKKYLNNLEISLFFNKNGVFKLNNTIYGNWNSNNRRIEINCSNKKCLNIPFFELKNVLIIRSGFGNQLNLDNYQINKFNQIQSILSYSFIVKNKNTSKTAIEF